MDGSNAAASSSRLHSVEINSSSISSKGSFYTFYTFDFSYLLHHGVQTLRIPDIEADIALEYAVMALYADLADVDAEIARNHFGQVEQQPHAVDAAYRDAGKVGDGLMLRPFDLLFDDVASVLRSEPVKFVAVGFVDDDLAALSVPEAHHAVARNRLAALGDFKARLVG